MVRAALPLNVVPEASPEPPLLNVTALATEPADPVVFWFSVGMSAATTALNVGAPAEPLGAAKKKFAVLLAYGFCVSP